MNKKILSGVSDAELRDALEDANIPTLQIVLAQITGDPAYITGNELPSTSLEGVRNISVDRQRVLKEAAFQLFTDMRDGKTVVTGMPDTKTLQRMLSVYVNDNVGVEYVPMFLEDMGFSNSLENHIQWKQSPNSSKLDENHVIIVGSGISGISAGVHLKKAGIPFTILEKNSTVGGTWYENTYPACGVDTPNHFYSFSFEPNSDWTSYYSKRDEIFAYIKNVAEKYGLMEHIRFNCSLDDATYDETFRQWDLKITNAEAQKEALSSRFFISAVGQLNRPVVPAFKGKDSFQ
ncbi:MAG: NAD(P)/FAD-dependent oxidoreductase, partial [Sneathiella sp.]